MLFLKIFYVVSLALSNLHSSKLVAINFHKSSYNWLYKTFNYMKCGLQNILHVEFVGNMDAHSLSVFV
jgi:hypothetical protein